MFAIISVVLFLFPILNFFSGLMMMILVQKNVYNFSTGACLHIHNLGCMFAYIYHDCFCYVKCSNTVKQESAKKTTLDISAGLAGRLKEHPAEDKTLGHVHCKNPSPTAALHYCRFEPFFWVFSERNSKVITQMH